MMQFCVNCALVILLLMMARQDIRYRGIYWYHFVLLAFFLVLSRDRIAPAETAINIGFIAAVYALVTSWFSFKSGRWINLLLQHIGLGDLLFLACLALYFPFTSFFLFIC